MDKKYFHEIDKKEVDELIKGKKTWEYIMANYKQPDWCGYHDALRGLWGCWSLTGLLARRKGEFKISKEFCSKCDCFKSEFN